MSTFLLRFLDDVITIILNGPNLLNGMVQIASNNPCLLVNTTDINYYVIYATVEGTNYYNF